MNIRQSTARTVIVGPVLDSTGAAKTDEAVGSVLASKNGGDPAALDASASLTHKAAGYYRLALTVNDTDTLGCLELILSSGTNTMPVKALNVLSGAAWDALQASGYMPSNAMQLNGNATAAAAMADYTVARAAKLDYLDVAITSRLAASGGTVGSVSGAVGSVTGSVGSVVGNVGGNVVGSVGSVTGAVGSVTGNVGGNVAGSVASVTGAVSVVNGAGAGEVPSLSDIQGLTLVTIPAYPLISVAVTGGSPNPNPTSNYNFRGAWYNAAPVFTSDNGLSIWYDSAVMCWKLSATPGTLTNGYSAEGISQFAIVTSMAGQDANAGVTISVTITGKSWAQGFTNGGDSSGVTTLLGRVVGTLAAGTHVAQSGDGYGILNNGTYGNSALNTAIGTRMATFSYTAPDNAGIAAIQAQTDQFVFTTPGLVDASAEATVDNDAIANAIIAAIGETGVVTSGFTGTAATDIAGIENDIAAIDVRDDVAAAIAGVDNISVIGIVDGQHITLVRGDSYESTDARRKIAFTRVAGESWPTDLTGYTITFTARKSADNPNTGDATFTASGTVTTATGDSQAVTLATIASTATDSLAIGEGTKGYVWDLVATASGGKEATLRMGTMTVKEDQTHA